ncbi:LacI family DNA-binding transcriptional regulator [Diaminobutyricibacter sp. McL0618]|uniref:LacI family DNA-binding transcriptional regulator n=1 Tax=Leifsonia sp. McL0618 TaxID=3415677 RepID=UPI003CE6BD4D
MQHPALSEQTVTTLQHVADRAGVSRATASLALTGKGRMAPATRQRVQDAASELGYVANPTARALRTARSGSVGLYVPDHTLSFRYYMDVAFGAVAQGQQDDLLVTLMPTVFEPKTGILEHLDGFIMIDPIDDDPIAARLLGGRRPVVSGEGAPPGMPEPSATVFTDHGAGMRLLLDHLWSEGARRPACLLPVGIIAWGREMREGYEAWCAEKGVAPRILFTSFHTTTEEVRMQCDELFADLDGVDALVTAAEGTAVIALDSLRAAGIDVGRDLLLASYVDSDPLATIQPSVTALDLHPREFGRRCMQLLAEAIEGTGEPGRSVEMPVSLIVRESSRRSES